MGTQRRGSPFPRKAEVEEVSDDGDSFIFGMDSESEYSSDDSSSAFTEHSGLQLPPLKPKDPRSKAKYNVFSRFFFLWLEPLFWLGCQRELDYSDLYTHPSEADSEKLLSKFNRYWTIELERKKRGGKARLMVALMKCFWWRLVLQGFSILIETAILVCQSIILGLLTDFFSIEEPTTEDTRNAYLYALGLVLMTILVVVMHSHSFLMGQKMSMISRIITTGAIYKKVLCLSQVEIAQVSIGHIINLASNDVQRFDPAFPHLPYLWVAPLHLVAFTYLVYQEFGWTVFLASGFLLLQIPMQIVMAKLFVYLRLKSARITDKRVRIMNEIISGIRVIKMYAWENAFRKVISDLRKNESFIIFKGAIIRAFTLANMIVSISIIMWIMMTAFVGSGGEPNTRQVFTTLSLLTSLRLSTYFFVLAILGYSEGQVAISRIQSLLELECEGGSTNKFLEDFNNVQLKNKANSQDLSFANPSVEENVLEVCDSELNEEEDGSSLTNDDTVKVSLQSLSASWNYQRNKKVLHNITFEVNRDIPLLAVVGPVGSGKSTLLQCLLGELKPISGKVEVRGRLSYVSQDPWMFMGTIRDNILFGMSYDPSWYRKVIDACALDEDFRQLPFGDLTLVGEKGVTLSGGQKARVNLARAVYHDADVFLLDDPLSAVDAAVAAHLFNKCIRGLLSEHLVVLVTHQLQFALKADKILVIKEGCQEVYGSCEELVSQGINPNFLLGMIKDDEDTKEREDWDTPDFKVSGYKLQKSDENELHTTPPLQYNSPVYMKTPFEMMHEAKSASSDDQETDEDSLSPRSLLQHFSIQTATPTPSLVRDSPTESSLIDHSSQSSSESDVEPNNESPDFPKFRLGLLSQEGSHVDQSITSSPDFPKFKPGLLSPKNPDEQHSSPDFPKFRPGLLTDDYNSTLTSPDFPKIHDSLLSQQNEHNHPTGCHMSTFKPSHLYQHNSANTNISPDFPKFRPGLLNGHRPSSPPFKLASPPYNHSCLRSSNFSPRSDFYSSPTSPSNSSGYITPHLKCPVSPLARTSAQSRFPHIRSILKPPTGGPLVVANQAQGRTPVSPLRKKVLQHNADLLLLRKGEQDSNDLSEKASSDHSLPTLPTSPTPLPAQVPASSSVNRGRLSRGSPNSEFCHLNPLIEYAEPDNAEDSGVVSTALSTPLSPNSAYVHVHFAYTETKESQHDVPPLDQVNQVNINKGQKGDASTLPFLFLLPPTPSTEQEDSSSSVTPNSVVCNLHRENQAAASTISASPTSQMDVPRRYSRRKSVTFEQQMTRTSPLDFPNYRKSPLSPTTSRYYKRRRSIATVGHKQKLSPSPHLPTHVYRKVSLSPVYSVQHRQSSGQNHHSHVKRPHPQISSHALPAPINHKRRKSVSVVSHRESDNDNAKSRHHKRRKSVSILTRHEREHYPVDSRLQRRRKSVSIMTHHNGEHHPVDSRLQRRRKSVSILTRHNGEHHPVDSRLQKRRKSVSILTRCDDEQNRSPPVTSKHFKRRKSVSIVTEHECGQQRTFLDASKSISDSTQHANDKVFPLESRYHQRRKSDSILANHTVDHHKSSSKNSRHYKRRKSTSIVGHEPHHTHLMVPSPHLPVHVYRHISMSSTQLSKKHSKHRGSISRSEQDLQPKSQISPVPPRSVPMSPINYKRQTYNDIGHTPNYGRIHTPSTPLRSPGHFLRRNLSRFSFLRKNRRKSVLVINRDNHLIPLTSPAVNRVHLGAYQRSLPTTPLPRRYASRKSLNSIIAPRTPRRLGNNEQVQVTVEAARFDVTSIYSAKSFLSLAPNTISREKPTIESTIKQDDMSDDEEFPELIGEDKGEGSISMKLYYHFFRAGGNILLLLALIAIFILGETGVVVSDWWLSDWADCTSQIGFTNDTLRSTCLLSPAQRIGIYTFTTSVAVLLNFARAILFYFICLRASYILHNRMFSSILRTCVQFFDNNPAGRILNRFSKDIGFLDDLLPYIFCEYLLLLLRCIAVITTAVASNPWVAILAVILIGAFLALRWYYLRTSREVKRLEAVARSPVYSHITITLHGLPMIRSLGQQHVMMDQFHTYQNQHSQGWYLYLVTVRWFGLRIDILSSLFLVAVAFFSVPLASQLNAGLVGLGLTYVISLADMLQYTIRLSADVENTMVSAERVIGYGNLEEEAALDTHSPDEKPPPSWPDKGHITFEDVAFQYSSELPPVLKDLCFTIQPAEKVGVVGRTGAGKSSLISVLYRLAEPNGLITIDGVDTKAIGLHDLRKKMSIIPQDPVLFSGTMRYNLDPFDEYKDAELWAAVEQVQLKSAVQQLEGGLEGEVSEGGSNFSVGQRQLVCLARALLRKNKILVLDEATANVDQRTDEVIQMTIREIFSDCTVIAIAHRLDTIMDSDKIMLLKKGKLREFDSPYNLLQDPTSKFYKMVEKTGPVSAERLHQIALNAHLRRTFGSKSTKVLPLASINNDQSSRMTALVARTLLQQDTATPLSRIEERRPSIISSSSYPCALNEIGTNAGMNANDPNLQNLRLPSDPNLSMSSRSMFQADTGESETTLMVGEAGSNEVPSYNG